MKKLIMVLTMMSVLMCLSTETIAQDKWVTIPKLYSTVIPSTVTPTEWYLGVSPQVLVSYNIKSEEEDKYGQDLILNLEVGRLHGSWYNAVGYNLLNRAAYSLNVYRVANWKFPLEVFAYGEYSGKRKDGVVNGAFVSVGPQTKLADEKCILALTFGTPTAEWKPSIGLLVIYPLMTKL